MERVCQYIDQHREEYVALLEEFCASGTAAGLIRDRFEAMGAETELIETEGGPVVHATLGGGGRRLAICNHYDAQPPEAEAAPALRGGRLCARGAADDRANLLARMLAAEAYVAVHGAPPCALRFLVEGAGGSGSKGLAALRGRRPELARADAVLASLPDRAGEGAPEIAVGSQGLCVVELRCKSIKGDMHSSLAAILPSASWRLVWALRTLKDDEDRITVKGLDAGNLVLNICGIEAGYTGEGSKTVLPASAACRLEFHLPAGFRAAELSGLLRAHLEAAGYGDVEVVELIAADGHPAQPGSAIASAAAEAVRAICGEPPAVIAEGAARPALGFLFDPDMPVAAFGCADTRSAAHTAGESVAVEEFIRAVKLSAAAMHRFGGGALS